MCTVSWWRNQHGYGLLFNRDESRRRLEARPPVVFAADGCAYISPVDTDAGGTWIWVNMRGVIACLLNYYPQLGPLPATPVSRGLLLKSLACQPDGEAVQGRLVAMALEAYLPFLLLVVEEQERRLFTWNGAALTVRQGEAVSCPQTTSGYLPGEVVAYRLALYASRFEKNVHPEPAELADFHCLHDPDRPAHSVLMCRADARTVSQSRIEVDADTITFAYASVSDRCRLLPAVVTTLPRSV